MPSEKSKVPVVFIDSLKSPNSLHSDCDCSDCACSQGEVSSLSSAFNQAVPLVKTSISYTEKLDAEHILYYGPFHQPVVLNRVAQELLDQFETAQPLHLVDGYSEGTVREVVAKLYESRLLHPVGYIPVLQQKKELLTAWLHVTDRCNLRCSYCYLPHVRQDMDFESGKEVIDAIFNAAISQKYGRVKLKYAGGEALLKFPLIQQLHQHAQKVAERCCIKLEGVILSNGTLLTKSIAETINSLGLNLMISLDGLGRVHDAHRPYAGGRGTFNDVQKGIQLAEEANVSITISITISNENADGLPELVRWILARGLRFNLNFYRQNEHAGNELSMEDKRIVRGMLGAYKEIEDNLPNYSLLDAIVDRANLAAPHLRTCGVGQNYMVFDPSGHVSKCQMHLYSGPSNHQTSKPLEWIQTSPEGIQNLSVEDKEGCNSCQWKYWCAGGCPLLTYHATGKFDSKSPNCLIYKAIYPKAMRLEGLRLIQINEGCA